MDQHGSARDQQAEKRSWVFSIPLRTRFRGIVVREGMLIRGPAGWGEFSPFWDYRDDESAPWLRAAIEAAFDGWPPAIRESVPVNAIVPAVGPDQVAELIARSGGCTTAKVKVAEPGQSESDDLARVEAARDALGPAGRVRIDANGGWDVETAIRMIKLLARWDLEYVEQPCRTVEELAAVRKAVDLPVAADESIRRSTDPLRVVQAEAADIVVLKAQPLGGVRACLQLAAECGLPAVVSSAVETSVGLAAGLALAAALPELPYACGLGTIDLLDRDVVEAPLVPIGGALPVRRPAPDVKLLAAAAADPPTAERWHARLHDVRHVLDHSVRDMPALAYVTLGNGPTFGIASA